MKKYIILLFALIGILNSGFAQIETKRNVNFYIGASYGTSFSIGDFKDNNIENENAGFAKNGSKAEIYGGKVLNDKVTLTATFRYQNFGTDKDGLIDFFNNQNTGQSFEGFSEDWETFSLLLGASYKVLIGSKIDIYPRIGIGPMMMSNPEININSNNSNEFNYILSSVQGIGLGYEFGFGTSTDLGKRLVLLPTFTFSGGLITLLDVKVTENNVSNVKDYKPKIHSFNLGFSIAYKFFKK